MRKGRLLPLEGSREGVGQTKLIGTKAKLHYANYTNGYLIILLCLLLIHCLIFIGLHYYWYLTNYNNCVTIELREHYGCPLTEW